MQFNEILVMFSNGRFTLIPFVSSSSKFPISKASAALTSPRGGINGGINFNKYTCFQSTSLKNGCSFTSSALEKRHELITKEKFFFFKNKFTFFPCSPAVSQLPAGVILRVKCAFHLSLFPVIRSTGEKKTSLTILSPKPAAPSLPLSWSFCLFHVCLWFYVDGMDYV